jgi:hypothetical protein
MHFAFHIIYFRSENIFFRFIYSASLYFILFYFLNFWLLLQLPKRNEKFLFKNKEKLLLIPLRERLTKYAEFNLIRCNVTVKLKRVCRLLALRGSLLKKLFFLYTSLLLSECVVLWCWCTYIKLFYYFYFARSLTRFKWSYIVNAAQLLLLPCLLVYTLHIFKNIFYWTKARLFVTQLNIACVLNKCGDNNN